jgi:hypothetical protein
MTKPRRFDALETALAEAIDYAVHDLRAVRKPARRR